MKDLSSLGDKIPVGVSLAWPAAALVALDVGIGFFGSARVSLFGIEPVSYVAAVFGLTLTLLLLHLGAALGVIGLSARFWSRSMWPWLAVAALFGLAWQDTLMHGDGIRSRASFGTIRVAGALVAPLGLAAFVWLVGFCERIAKSNRQMIAAFAASVGAAVHFVVLTEYRPFHGYLAAFVVACATWAVMPLLRSKTARIGGALLVGCALVAAGVTLAQRDELQPQVQSFSHTAASIFEALPLARPLRVEPARLETDSEALSDEQRQRVLQFFEPARVEDPAERRGDNVLLIVLESTRADYWAEPDLAPRFHGYKERGVYFPRAIAPYPATPLAYGAMFAAQTPRVLAQSPYWSEHRLFDHARPQFDDVILTRPQSRWFTHNAITDFFVPRDTAPHGHQDGEHAFEYVRERLATLESDDSFFAWVHLYEPHAPYDARAEFVEGDGKRAAYRSEISWTDDRLGAFMEWFYASPHADDTLVIIVGDHGEGMGEEVLGEPYWGHHVHVHETVSRVPLFVSGPGLPAGARESEVLAGQLDVMPTIFDFIGLEMPAQALAQGSSLYAVIDQKPARALVTEAFSIRGTKFFNFIDRAGSDDPDKIARQFHKISTEGSTYSPKIGLQYGRHKLVYHRMLRRYWLYDTDADPLERHDLSAERPELLAEMKQRLNDWATAQRLAVEQLNERLVD